MNNTSLEALVFALIAVLGTGGPSAIKVLRDLSQLWTAINEAVKRLNDHDTALNGNLDARIAAQAEAVASRIVRQEIARLPAPVQLVIHQAEGVLTDALSAAAVPAVLPRGGMAGSLQPGGSAGPPSPGGQAG